VLRATFKSLLSRKLRLVLSGMAVVLGVMFVSGAFVLTDTLGRSFDGLFATVYSGVDVGVTAKPKVDSGDFGSPEEGLIPASVVDKVRTAPGVASAKGTVGVDGARVIGSDGKVVTTFGPPRIGEAWSGTNDLVQLREGRGPTADDEIAVNSATAKAAGLHVGDRVGVLTLAPKKTFALVGIFGYSGNRDSLGGALEVAFTPPVAQQLMLGKTGVYSGVDVKAQPGVTPDQLRADVAAAIGPDYDAKTRAQLTADASKGIKAGLGFFNNILIGFAGVALFVGTFLILNTFSIIVAQRTRELALMRALGGSRKQMIGSVLIEAVVVGLIASVLGLAAGVGVGTLLAYVFAHTGGSSIALAPVEVPAASVIAAFAVGILVTVFAAILPALRASRIPPMAALREAATPDRPLTALSVSGAVVGAFGGTMLGIGLSGNGGGNTLLLILGGVLLTFIGVALLTPLIARPVVGLIGRLFSWSVPGKLGRMNSGRNPRRTAITAAALMVGLALITGVNVVLTSATKSLKHLADTQTTADLIISGDSGSSGPATFDPAILDQIKQTPGVARSVGAYEEAAKISDKVRFVATVTDMPAWTSLFKLTAAGGELAFTGNDQIVLDADSAKSANVHVGDVLPVQFTEGAQHRMTIVGIYAKSDLINGWIVSPDVLKDFHNRSPDLAFAQVTPGTPVVDVQHRIDALLKDSPEVTVSDRSQYVDQQAAQYNSLLSMIQILLALAILIAVMGIINTLALSVLERTRELGLLRAIGLRRAQAMRMVTVEAVVISVFGALLGLVVGTGLGIAVVRALKSQGFTELAFPWTSMATYLLLAAVVGVVAAIIPAIRAARVNVLQAIAYE
jgi:putative ABC transport system permease protein